MKIRHATPLLLLLIPVAGFLSSHPDEKWESDRLPPYTGPGMTNPETGRATIDFPAENVTLLSWLTIPQLDAIGYGANDCWGYTSPSGREYGIIGTTNAIAFVEVTDPGRPDIVASMPTTQSFWHDIKTYEDHAYSIDETGGGIQVFDLSRIDDGIVESPTSIIDSNGTAASHNIAINEESGYLYRVGGGVSPNEGLRIYDLTDKRNPQFVATWDDRYVHDAQIVTYTTGPFAGREIAFCFAEDDAFGTNPGIDILDVTDKSNITVISSTPHPGVFSHQGWLTEDRQYVYVNDEIDEFFFGGTTTTRILDVSDLTAPFFAGEFTTGSTSLDHNCFVKGNTLYEGNYRSGLHVFDVTDPLNPVRTGFFDTFVEDDIPNFNGIWGIYPFFPSGTVIGSDIEKGLFVWRVGPAPIRFEIQGAAPAELVSNKGGSLEIGVTEVEEGSLDPRTVMLHVDTGSGFVARRMHGGKGGVFKGRVGSLECGQTFSYFFSAQTTDGITWREPQGAPINFHTAVAARSKSQHALDDLEVDRGWIVGDPADTATTGVWVRVDPIGTAAQPEDDVSPDPGVQCWVTGQGSLGGGLGENDVDGGQTTLISPVLDATVAADAYVGYWRWYSNSASASPFEDVFQVDISGDDGATWVPLETVGPDGPEVQGGWVFRMFPVGDFVAPTSQVRLRFIASDLGGGSIVEAAVDDVQILSLDCRGK